MARIVRGNRSHVDGAAQIWAEATAFRDGHSEAAPIEKSRPVIAAVVDRERSVLAVALDNEDQIVAFAVAAPAVEGQGDPIGTAEVAYVGVCPGEWGTGLARGVLERLCDELTADGFTRAQLWVYIGNQRAVGVYERLGWHAEGRPRPHGRTGKPEQRYRRTLGR